MSDEVPRLPISRIYSSMKSLLNKDVLMAVLPYRELKYSQNEWNSQYASGSWNGLNEIEELAHYSVIAGYCRFRKVAGRILDIGCGSGQLFEHLKHLPRTYYQGIDISDEAVSAAQELANETASFVQANAESYLPTTTFDGVIFNECLYYFDDPVGLLERYASFASPGGELIVSMFGSQRSKRIWKALEKAGFRPIDTTTVSNHHGMSWTIKLFGI